MNLVRLIAVQAAIPQQITSLFLQIFSSQGRISIFELNRFARASRCDVAGDLFPLAVEQLRPQGDTGISQ